MDVAILGGAAWLLGGVAQLGGAILQRWQSGNLRSYAAWLALGAAALLLFVFLPWTSLLARNRHVQGGTLEMAHDEQLDSHVDPPGAARRSDRDRALARSRQAARVDRAAHALWSPSALRCIFRRTFIAGQPGFQFEINRRWIENPADLTITSASMA